jgi:hypothetical protein
MTTHRPCVVFSTATKPFGLFCLHAAIKLTQRVIDGLRDLQNSAGVFDSLVLGNRLVSNFELADDLLGCVADAFLGGVPFLVWPAEDAHSRWTDS